MSNVSDSVKAFADGFGIPRPRMGLVARTIRENDHELVPRDPVGRNQGTQLLPSHLVNLMIGAAVGDPIANATALVRAYRAAGYVPPMAEVLGKVKVRLPVLGGLNLGLDLEGLVNFLARPSAKQRKMRLVFPQNFRVTLVVGEALVATVEDTATGRVDQYDAKGQHTADEGQTFRVLGVEHEVVPLRRIATLEFAHFELAAALWADSLRRGAVYTPSFLDSSDDEPGAETAAPGPCRVPNAAEVSDQTAGTVLDGASQLHSSCERGKPQSRLYPRADRPLQQSRTIHDRSHSHSACATLA